MKIGRSHAKKDLSRFLQSQPNIFLAKILPISVYHQYLSFIGFYFFWIRERERHKLHRSMQSFLGKRYNQFKIRRMLYKTYNGIIEHYSEKMINAYRSLPDMQTYLRDNVSIPNSAWLDAASSNNRGCIFITAHFGAVEYLPLCLASKGYRPTMIVRFKTNRLRDVLMYKSQIVDLELIDADRQNVVFEALKAVKKGRILITLCDEIKSWRPCSDKSMDIFGQTIPQDRTLDVLFKRANVPCCLGLMLRRKIKYDLSIHPLNDGEGGSTISEAAWHILEKNIYRYPEQWYQWPNFESEYLQYKKMTNSYAY
jgi:lauroyl/myristoyl acyltransferase